MRAVASRDPRGRDLPDGAVRLSEPGDDPIRLLRQADELGVPLYRHAPVVQGLAQQSLVVVLAQDQEEGIRTEVPADVAQRDARRSPSPHPQVGAGRALAELERPPGDPEMGVDLERAGLDAERTRLERRARVAIYDRRTHALPAELIGEHQAGRAGADDQDIGVAAGRCVRLSANDLRP